MVPNNTPLCLDLGWSEGRGGGEFVGADGDITWPGAQLPQSSPPLVAMVTCSKLPSEDGSVISNESERLKPGRGSTAMKVTAQQKATKEETRRKDGESPETETKLRCPPAPE